MPRTKRGPAASAGNKKPATSKQQSSLSFGAGGSRVTKPSSSARNSQLKTASAKVAKLESFDESRDSASPAPIDLPAEPVDPIEPSTTSTLSIRAQLPSSSGAAPELTPQESTALALPESSLKKYWAGKEAERLTKRVHQEDLGLHEKILREFDMSTQYGPCMGVARIKRWKLANELGLSPPVEVLSVLLKEDERVRGEVKEEGVTEKEGEEKRVKVQRAFVDELMSSKFVVD